MASLRFEFVLPKELHADVKALAASTGVSAAEVTREALRAYLAAATVH